MRLLHPNSHLQLAPSYLLSELLVWRLGLRTVRRRLLRRTLLRRLRLRRWLRLQRLLRTEHGLQ